MYECGDLRKGLKIEIDGDPYVIVQFEFVKPGKGQALYKCKLKNMLTGAQFDRTFRSGDKFNEDNPRIVLSTIHKAKGGEADNVALFLESTKACCTMGDPDGERRVFYVGATRAKENLHIIDPPSAKWRFQV